MNITVVNSSIFVVGGGGYERNNMGGRGEGEQRGKVVVAGSRK